MGLTKTELFTQSQNELAHLAKALAHPARIAIIQHLLKMETCICGELVDEIGLSQPTISQHLRELKKIGLIQGQINGPKVCYCINLEKFSATRDAILALFNSDNTKNINCC